MKAVAKRWLGYLGYPALYITMLALFARLTFPYERVKDRLVSEFNAKQAASGMRLDIAEMGGYWLSGIKADGVKLTRYSVADTTGSTTAEDSKPRVTLVDELYGSVSLIRLVFGRLAGSFGAKVQAGQVDGSFASSDAEQSLEVTFKQMGVGDVPLLSELAGLPLKGTIDGQLEVVVPEKKLAKAEGKIDLTFTGVSAGDGKAKILKVIALPELKVGNLKLGATITEGRVKLDNVEAKGKDFEMAVDGSIRLREPMASSMFDMGMRFRFLDSYKNKNDITKGLFGSAGVPGLFEMDEKVRRSKREDGFYGWSIIGTMDKPLIEPNPSGTSAVGRTGARGAATRRTNRAAPPAP